MNDATSTATLPGIPTVEESEGQMNSLLGMEDLENLNFDEIEEAPGFVIPPEGSYRLTLDKACIETYKTKEEPNKPKRRIAHYIKVLKVHELVDPKEKAPSEGSMFSERWQINSDGLKYWKSRAVSILNEDTTGAKVGDIIKMLNDGGFVFDAKIKHKETKSEKDGKTYTNINLQVTGRSQELPADTGI
jgi:hypothetical protein